MFLSFRAEPPSVPVATSAVAKGKVELIGNLKKKVYHLATCSDVRSSNSVSRSSTHDARIEAWLDTAGLSLWR